MANGGTQQELSKSTSKTFSLVDASITDLQHALNSGWVTSVDLVARYLQRISVYDASGLTLNAIPILNASVFEEAAASDARRVAGLPPRPLEGIPYLVKDSIKVKGMRVANGSPAFENLIATEDAACVQILRQAGAVLLGRTNMPAMAYGAMLPSCYGRAESPYTLEYAVGKYAAGSANGSAIATTASFCAFSLDSETISSGRSPTSTNAIVTYTPSRGILPLRGVWPLYPTCDVLVPHTRTMSDLFHVLAVLAVAEETPHGDFWNEQKIIKIPPVADIWPEKFMSLDDRRALEKKRIGVPTMYIGAACSPNKVCSRPSILPLWEKSKDALEACGATVVEVDFPLVTTYEAKAHTGQLVNVDGLPEDWPAVERCQLVAHAWDDFLTYNGQPGINSLSHIDPDRIFLLAPGSLPGAPDAASPLKWHEMIEYSKQKHDSIFQFPELAQTLKALETARKATLEKWMDDKNLDAVVFPSNGDIAHANADLDIDSSLYDWRDRLKYSNGNQPIRHLGVPTVCVPMGLRDDTGIPVSLTFAGKAYEDNNLLRYAFAFEQATKYRVTPPLVPELDSDVISKSVPKYRSQMREQEELPQLHVGPVKEIHDSTVHLEVQGSLQIPGNSGLKRNFLLHQWDLHEYQGQR